MTWRSTVVRMTAGALTVTIVAVSDDLEATALTVLLAAMAWLLMTSALAIRRGFSWRGINAMAVVDLAWLLAIAAVTGASASAACVVLWLAPIAWAIVLRRTAYSALVVVAPVGYLLLWLPDGLAANPGSFRNLATFAGMYAGALVLGIITLQLRIQSRDQAAALQRARIALLHELSLVEQAEHERMSVKLHDGPLQALISARQDLEEYREGDREALEIGVSSLDDGIVGLRAMVSELFPSESTDIATRIDEICRRYEQRRTFAIDLDIDPTVVATRAEAAHDDLLVGIVGELIANAAKHSGATLLVVTLVPCDGGIAIDVRDNGVGMAEQDHVRAASDGHIGLSSLDRRIRALGGRWRIRSAPGRGTSVHVELPR